MQKKKNSFSSSACSGCRGGFVIQEKQIFFFFYILRVEEQNISSSSVFFSPPILCIWGRGGLGLKNTLEFMERRRRIFFLLLHILRLDRFSSLENLCPPRQELIYQEKKKKYSTSLLQKIFAHPDTSLSINSRRRNILLLFSRKSLPTQTRAPPSTEEEEIFYFSSLENLCPPRHELIHQQKQKKYCTSFLHLLVLTARRQ